MDMTQLEQALFAAVKNILATQGKQLFDTELYPALEKLVADKVSNDIEKLILNQVLLAAKTGVDSYLAGLK